MSKLKELKELHSTCNPRCVVNTCKRGKCKVIIDTLTNAVCIDCDICGEFGGEDDDKDKKPDYVILYDNKSLNTHRWAIIEMKSRISHPKRIEQQLQKGADVIAKSKKFDITESPFTLYAFVVKQKHIRSSDFAQRCIKFHGKKTRITVIKSPSKLSSLLN